LKFIFKRKIIILLIVGFFFTQFINGVIAIKNEHELDIIDINLNFEKPVIEYILESDHPIITINNLSLKRIPGKPIIPYKKINILLPPNSEISNIHVVNKNLHLFKVNNPIKPSNLCTSFSFAEYNNNLFFNNSIYQSKKFYPENFIQLEGIQYFRGYAIAFLTINPVRYNPAMGLIQYFSDMIVQIETKHSENNQNTIYSTDYSNEINQKVINPSMKNQYKLNNNIKESYEYIIITLKKFIPNFEKLITHKSQYINSTIVALEDIIENETFWVHGQYGDATNIEQGNPFIKVGFEATKNLSLFNDTTAKIRNFIRYAHLNWKTKYVLIGGDNELIPARRFYAYVDDWAAGTNELSIFAQILTDHYFSSLDGTWNDDCDINFGETINESIREEADFLSELYIGRAPVNDKSDADIFVNKLIDFEISEKPKDILIHQSYTNRRHKPDTSVVSDSCTEAIPNSFIIHKLYEKNGKISTEQWVDAFNNPKKLLIYQVGNGYNDGLKSWYQLCWKNGIRVNFNIMDIGHLNNSFYPLHVSISCLTGDFSENECISEELLLTANGGPFACIANTEVGCITSEDASVYSGEYYEKLFENLFDSKSLNLGECIQLAKETYVSESLSIRQYRWCYYIMTLLGDPETEIHKIRLKAEYGFQTVYVDDDFTPLTDGWKTNKYSSIQSAIDNIDEFDTIVINEGIYQEEIFINKTVFIEGKEKESTIIENINNRQMTIFNLYCNSTVINNLTIQTQSNEVELNSLIHIYPSCNGNTISNCIIQRNKGKGIYLQDSIRNNIKNNIISANDCGIYIHTILEKTGNLSVIITCDNHIENNIIMNNRDCGIYISGSIHNFIMKNTFLSNGEKSDMSGVLNQHDLCLKMTRDNYINGNYWNEPLDKPHCIFSYRGPQYIFIKDTTRGRHFSIWKCIDIKIFGIPYWLVCDYNPAIEPNKI